MHRPLWQIFLTIFSVAFAVHRVSMIAILDLSEVATPSLLVAYALQIAAGLATALGIWSGRPWAVTAVLVLGTLVAATALLEGFFLGVRPPLAAVSETLVAGLATGALVLVLRKEFGSEARS